jgi:hypothetical protein
MIGYPGGKSRLSRTIVSFLPKRGRTYVEPFCGRGNLFWSAASLGLQYEKWWLNDVATIPFFDAIRRAGHTLRVPARCKEEYDSQKEAYQSGDLSAILLEPYLSFSGGGYFAAGRKLGGGASAVGYQKTIRQCHRIMHQTKPRLTSFDWRKMGLERLTDEDVVVLDPPYPDSKLRLKSKCSQREELQRRGARLRIARRFIASSQVPLDSLRLSTSASVPTRETVLGSRRAVLVRPQHVSSRGADRMPVDQLRSE